MSLQLGVQFQLLKTKLVAIYEKTGAESSFLLAPMDIKEVNSVSLKEMKDDFKAAFSSEITAKQIEDSLTAISNESNGENKFNLENLKFTLKTAYIYKKGNTKEYAFAIEVDCGDAIPDLGFVKIEKLAFKIWNTNKNVILQQLNLDTIENLVKKLDAPEKKIAEA
ncbi:hypothetical protein IM793_20855 [Pedobacter sp. MR2016-19]|uniref:hypothetical protein n=1 Tax=Pedobacter sp. MR2016-19 TaxID=2780089 RepID=UPI0018765F83|nr:hypothetical protein [Pedobacter sp. MR2016-19]MBE5321625.1 hypothetical protein [Pedobacter sp. MR2016-19]